MWSVLLDILLLKIEVSLETFVSQKNGRELLLHCMYLSNCLSSGAVRGMTEWFGGFSQPRLNRSTPNGVSNLGPPLQWVLEQFVWDLLDKYWIYWKYWVQLGILDERERTLEQI